MDDVRGDFLGPPHGTTPAAVITNKNNVRSFGSSKNTKLEDGPYCTISGNEPSSVTLYKTGSDSQTFCCNFKNLHLCKYYDFCKHSRCSFFQDRYVSMN